MKRLDLIIDALETSKPINQESSIPFDKHLKALAVARELRELEPVAIVDANDDGYWADILPDRNVRVGQPLYALGDEK